MYFLIHIHIPQLSMHAIFLALLISLDLVTLTVSV
jgi:hypothetical protein